MATTSKRTVVLSFLSLMRLILIQHSLMFLVLLVRLVDVGFDVSSGGPNSDSVSDSVPDSQSDPVSNDS